MAVPFWKRSGGDVPVVVCPWRQWFNKEATSSQFMLKARRSGQLFLVSSRRSWVPRYMAGCFWYMAWKKWRTGVGLLSSVSCVATFSRPNWHSDEAIVWKAELILAQLVACGVHSCVEVVGDHTIQHFVTFVRPIAKF